MPAGRPRKGENIFCLICGISFYVRPSRIGSTKYCSSSCSGQATGDRCRGVVKLEADKHQVKTCAKCGKEFKNNTPSVKFCSHDCYASTRKGEQRSTQEEKKRLQKIRDSRHGHIRRARLKNVSSESINVFDIFNRDKWKCYLCNKDVNKNLKYPHPLSVSLDHIVPISKGGAHLKSNVATTHLSCNLSKHNRSLQEQLILFG